MWNELAFWLTVIICLLSMSKQVAYRVERLMPRLHRGVPNWFRHHRVLVGLVFLVGAAVRIWQFGAIPAGFNQDGAMGAVDALALTQYGTDRFGMKLPMHFTAWGFGQMSVLLSYLSVPFIAVFGLNRITARIVVLLCSLVALWVVYLIGKKMWGKHAGLAVLAMAAINPWHVIQSRWALDCNLFPHFFLFGFYFLLGGMESKKKHMAAAMVCFALSMYAYGIAWYAVPLFLALAAGYSWWKHIRPLSEILLMAGIFLLVSWPIMGVMLVNVFRLETISFFVTIPFFPDTARTGDLLIFSEQFGHQLQTNLQAMINVAFLQKPDLPWNTIPAFGPMYLFSMPLALVAVVVLRKEKNKNTAFLWIWCGVAIFSGLLINQVNVNRLNIIFYPLIFLVGYGLYSVMKRIRIAGLVLLLLYMAAFNAFTVHYFTKTADVVAEAFYDGFGEALDAIDAVDYDVVVVTNWTMREGSWWVSEPLTLFHDSVDAQYFQGIKTLVGEDGIPLLPYKERYRYVDIPKWSIDPQKNEVFVVHAGEESYFSKDDYGLLPFGAFYAVIPKHLLP